MHVWTGKDLYLAIGFSPSPSSVPPSMVRIMHSYSASRTVLSLSLDNPSQISFNCSFWLSVSSSRYASDTPSSTSCNSIFFLENNLHKNRTRTNVVWIFEFSQKPVSERFFNVPIPRARGFRSTTKYHYFC